MILRPSIFFLITGFWPSFIVKQSLSISRPSFQDFSSLYYQSVIFLFDGSTWRAHVDILTEFDFIFLCIKAVFVLWRRLVSSHSSFIHGPLAFLHLVFIFLPICLYSLLPLEDFPCYPSILALLLLVRFEFFSYCNNRFYTATQS